MNIEPRLYEEIEGKIDAETVELSMETWKKKELKVKLEANPEKTYIILNSGIICKFGHLFGFSVFNLFKDLREKGTNIGDINNWVRETIKSRNKEVTLLLEKGQVKSVVSKNHKQMALDKVYSLVKSRAESMGLKTVSETEGKGTYQVEFEVGQDSVSSYRIRVSLGRNDALGRSSITFGGSGNVFVCSNQILPYVHRSVQVKDFMKVEPVRIIHVQGVDEKVSQRVEQCISQAKLVSTQFGEKLKLSQNTHMARSVQIKAINLMQERFIFPEKWLEALLIKINKEEETVFGLSQALTWVGTHEAKGEMKEKLCKLGGQVCLLGNDLVKLLEEIVKKDEEQKTIVEAVI